MPRAMQGGIYDREEKRCGKGETQRKEMWKRDATCLPKARGGQPQERGPVCT